MKISIFTYALSIVNFVLMIGSNGVQGATSGIKKQVV